MASAGRKLAIEGANQGMTLPLVTIAGFDIILMLHDGAHGLRGSCDYKAHLFSQNAIGRVLQDFLAAPTRHEPRR